MYLCFQELQSSSYQKHECSAKDARRPKFRGRNRYADVSPCMCLTVLHIFIHMCVGTLAMNSCF